MNEWKKELIDMKTEINDKIIADTSYPLILGSYEPSNIVKGSGIHCSKSKEFSKDVRPLWIILILAIIGIIAINLISPVSASLGTFKSDECVNIVTALNASGVNLTNVNYPSPNSSIVIANVVMTKIGNLFNYTFCNTSLLGTYTYGYCDNVGNCYSNDFIINPMGGIITTGEISIGLFASISTLILMFFFLFLAKKDNPGPNVKSDRAEIDIIRFFFVGLALVFLIAHIIITNSLINNIIGSGYLASAYTSVMYIFFTVIILMFLYIMAKITYSEIDNLARRRGLKA